MLDSSHYDERVYAMLNVRTRAIPSAVALIMDAWEFAQNAHAGQLRRSGEPHAEHLFETARILSELGMDPPTIAAGFLHDTIEDTDVSQADLQARFGNQIATLVMGVTKIEREHRAYRAYQTENLRRLFSASGQDARVLIIKLADRLHNMRTLMHLPERKRKLIAQETLDIYVPAAERLGMNVMKRELEDLAFSTLNSDEYGRISRLFAKRVAEREPALTEAAATLLTQLSFAASFPVRLIPRTKGKASFAKKLERKKGDLSAINDIITLQVIVPSTDDCYRTLGYVHALWRPVPGKMKDYISFPKPNGYQCLRTAVTAGTLGVVEIQIYSEAMFDRAQRGFAASLAPS